MSQSELTSAPHHTSPLLSDKPIFVIEPRQKWTALNLKEVWAHRELLYFLTWRDIKVRYKQSLLGVLWVLLQPLLMMVIFTVFLGVLARVPSLTNTPYPLFVYAGLLPWTFFSGSLVSSSMSLVGSSHLITKVYFPRVIIPTAVIAARLVDFGITLLTMGFLLLIYRSPLSWNILLLPILILLMIMLTLACGFWTSALNVKYRDIGLVLPVLIQVWMFASPVVYPTQLVPEKFLIFYGLNPLVGLIDGFRASLFGAPFNWTVTAISASVILILFISSLVVFRRVERGFADVV